MYVSLSAAASATSACFMKAQKPPHASLRATGHSRRKRSYSACGLSKVSGSSGSKSASMNRSIKAYENACMTSGAGRAKLDHTMSERGAVPKIHDVAELAGVSPSTVSRFYNNPSLLAAATAERIRKAIAETGYVPDLNAGALSSRRSRLVAVLVPEMAHSIFNDVIEAMVDQLSQDGYVVMLGLTGADNSGMKRLAEAALARRAEGIILSGVVSDQDTREQLLARTATVIETWGLPETPIDVAVGFSHEAVGAELARFLAGRGYQRPHLVVGDGERARMRRDAFLRTWRTLSTVKPTEMKVAIPTRFGHARLVWRR